MSIYKYLIAGAVGVILVGLAVFSILQAIEESEIAEARDSALEQREQRESVDAIACETYIEYSYVNWKEDMTREDYEDNYIALVALQGLGGGPEFSSLLADIVEEYELLFDGEDGEPVFAMADLDDWCEPYLSE
jgi:hypothetical protein